MLLRKNYFLLFNAVVGFSMFLALSLFATSAKAYGPYYEVKSGPTINLYEGTELLEVQAAIEKSEWNPPFGTQSLGTDNLSFVFKSVVSPPQIKEKRKVRWGGSDEDLAVIGEYRLIRIDGLDNGKKWGERDVIRYQDYGLSQDKFSSTVVLITPSNKAYIFDKRSNSSYTLYPTTKNGNLPEDFNPVDALENNFLRILVAEKSRTFITVTVATAPTYQVNTIKAPPTAGETDNGADSGSTDTYNTPASSSSEELAPPTPVLKEGLLKMLNDPNGFISKGWKITRSLVNLLLIFILILVSFSHITGLSIKDYEVKRALPGLIIGILLANVSYFLTKFIIDISNSLVYLIIELTNNVTEKGTLTTFGSFIQEVVKIIGTGGLTVFFEITNTSAIGALFRVIAGIISIVGLIWLSIVFYLRLLYIYVLVIVAPLALVMYGIPQLNKYFKQWLQLFIKWVFLLPAVAAIFAVLVIFVSTSAGSGNFVALILTYVIFFTAVGLPSKIGGSIINNVTNGVKRFSGYDWGKKTATGWAKDTAGRKARIAWTGSPLGQKLIQAQKYLEQGKNNEEQRIKLNIMRVDNKVAKSSAARRASILDMEKKVFEEELNKTKKTIEAENLVSENKCIMRLREQMTRASSESDAYNKTVEKLTTKLKGDYAADRNSLLKQILDYKDIDKAKKDLEDAGKTGDADKIKDATNKYEELSRRLPEIERVFNERKGNHPDFARFDTVEDAYRHVQDDKILSSLVTEEQKRHSGSLNDRDEVMTKDDIEEGNVGELTRTLTELFEKLGEDISGEIVKGKTHGLDPDDQRKFIQSTFALKKIAADRRNAQSQNAILSMLKILADQGRRTMNIMEKDGTVRKVELAEVIKMAKSGKGINQVRQALDADVAFAGKPGKRYESHGSKEIN